MCLSLLLIISPCLSFSLDSFPPSCTFVCYAILPYATRSHHLSVCLSVYMLLSDWRRFVTAKISNWAYFYNTWLDAAPAKDVIILFFDDLVTDLSQTLVNLAYFLGYDGISREVLQCARRNAEGHFHRERLRPKVDPFKEITMNMSRVLKYEEGFKSKVRRCLSQHTCVTAGCDTIPL